MGTARGAEGEEHQPGCAPSMGRAQIQLPRAANPSLGKSAKWFNTIQLLETTTLSLSFCREVAGTSSSAMRKGFNAPKSHPGGGCGAEILPWFWNGGGDGLTKPISPCSGQFKLGSSLCALQLTGISEESQGKLHPWQQCPPRARAGHDCPTTEMSPELTSCLTKRGVKCNTTLAKNQSIPLPHFSTCIKPQAPFILPSLRSHFHSLQATKCSKGQPKGQAGHRAKLTFSADGEGGVPQAFG